MNIFEMVEDKNKEKYEDILKKIEKYNHHYYNLNESLVTDYEYDMLLKELKNIEEKYPKFKKENSPTNIIGGLASDKFTKVKHRIAMLSLSNTYNIDDLIDFEKRIKNIVNTDIEYILELKLDGLSISLIYEKGKFVKAITRGDGNIGEDVTENVLQISSVPKKLSQEIDIEVRGEIVLPLSEFNRINLEREENNLPLLANPRNAASGTLRQLDSSIVKERNLSAYIYYIIEPEKYDIKNHLEGINFLEKLGFKTTGVFEKISNILEMKKRIDYWSNERKKLDFETDGMVIKVNNFSLYDKLGFTAKSPRWAIAYKFKAEQKETTLLDVTYQVGRTGNITPVAELEAINLSGSIVKRASLHNFDEIDRLGLKINDKVVVQKAAEIIPQIVRVCKEKRRGNEREINKPTNCPSCNSILVKEDDLVYLRCINDKCDEKIKRSIEYFVSRDALNIQGLGSKITDRLYDLGIIKDITDIFELKKYRDELINLEKMGEKSVDNLLINIEKSKDTSYSKLVYALGIENIGKTVSNLLTEKFNDIEKLKNAQIEDIESIDGFGYKMAKSVYDFFRNEQNLLIIEKLISYGFIFKRKEEEKIENSFISGKKFLATGKLDKYSREEIKEIILKRNGIYLSSVSKNLDYLIVGENAGSKLDKAKKLGINILTEEEFIKNIEKR